MGLNFLRLQPGDMLDTEDGIWEVLRIIPNAEDTHVEISLGRMHARYDEEIVAQPILSEDMIEGVHREKAPHESEISKRILEAIPPGHSWASRAGHDQ